MTALLRRKGFAPLMGAQFVSALADNALLLVAMALLVEQGQAAFWVPLLKLMFTLSYVVLGPWVGVCADTWPKQKVMMVANGVKALACMAMLIGVNPLLAFALAGVGAAAYAPAKYGLVTELAQPEQLVTANAWIEISTVSAVLLGVVVGGALVSPRLVATKLGSSVGSISRRAKCLHSFALSAVGLLWFGRTAQSLYPWQRQGVCPHAMEIQVHLPWFLAGLQKFVERPLGQHQPISHHFILGCGRNNAIVGAELGTRKTHAQSFAGSLFTSGYRCGRDCGSGAGGSLCGAQPSHSRTGAWFGHGRHAATHVVADAVAVSSVVDRFAGHGGRVFCGAHECPAATPRCGAAERRAIDCRTKCE